MAETSDWVSGNYSGKDLMRALHVARLPIEEGSLIAYGMRGFAKDHTADEAGNGWLDFSYPGEAVDSILSQRRPGDQEAVSRVLQTIHDRREAAKES